MRLPSPAETLYWMAVTVLTLPLGLIALTSVTEATLVGFPLVHPSLRWYEAALSDPANGRAALLSVLLAILSALLAVVAGTWIAVAASMLQSSWRWVFLAAAFVPLVTPGLVHAIALRVTIQTLGWAPGPSAMLIGHVIHATPLTVIMIGARLASIPPNLIEAASGLGAGPVRTFLSVVLPWLGPSLAGAALLSALNSFDDFIRSFFLGGYDQTLPVLLYGRMRSGLTPEITALATLTFGAVLLVAAAISWLARPKARGLRQALSRHDPA